MEADVLVVGAGISGLALARALHRGGIEPLVLEKSRGVGGRVATRRVEGQPVDHGVAFLHGSHPDFLAALDAVEATAIEGWPERVEGGGRPCQPEALKPRQRRIAFEEGLTAFPKSLARGLEVRKGVKVAAIELRGTEIRLSSPGSEPVSSRDVVLALPLEQALALLEPLVGLDDALRPAASLLEMIATEPCLAVIAGYHRAPEPAWDILYPSDGDVLMLLSHDSAKRRRPRSTVLVLQCTARFSRAHLEQEPSGWVPRVLEEASRLVGSWAGAPNWHRSHRWRYSRVGTVPTLREPLLVALGSGSRIGLVGEAFSPGGGVEGAFLSGHRLANRFLESAVRR